MLESEMNEHLGYEKYEYSSESNYRNSKKTKKIKGKYVGMDIKVPQDRNSTFEPKVVPKRKKDISAIEYTKKWTLPLRNPGKVYGKLSIMYSERLEKQHQKSEYQV